MVQCSGCERNVKHLRNPDGLYLFKLQDLTGLRRTHKKRCFAVTDLKIVRHTSGSFGSDSFPPRQDKEQRLEINREKEMQRGLSSIAG
jgi:hypothetical protein